MNLYTTLFYMFTYMYKLVWAGQQRTIFIISGRTLDALWRTCQVRWILLIDAESNQLDSVVTSRWGLWWWWWWWYNCVQIIYINFWLTMILTMQKRTHIHAHMRTSHVCMFVCTDLFISHDGPIDRYTSLGDIWRNIFLCLSYLSDFPPRHIWNEVTFWWQGGGDDE